MRRQFSIILYFLSIILMAIGYGCKAKNIILLGLLVVLIANLYFGICKLKDRLLFILFNISMFTFLIGDNIICFFTNKPWMAEFSDNTVIHCLVLVYIGLIGVFVGTLIQEKQFNTYIKKIKKDYFRVTSMSILRKIIFVIFVVSGICQLIVILDKISIVNSFGYVESYVMAIKTPTIIVKVGQLFMYSFFIYLATLPSKKNTITIIIIYMIYLVITLATGVRGTFIYNIFAILFYYLMRHFKDDKEEWVTKRFIVVFLISIPIVITLLVVISSTRLGIKDSGNNFLGYIQEFFFQQSASIRVIGYAKDNSGYISNLNQNYTFGPIINLFRTIFTGISFNNNTVDIALHGNSFGSTISYIKMAEIYLQGGGLGSSYLAEVYADYGYLGTLTFSILLGMLLSYINTVGQEQWWERALGLICIIGIISMPRSEALGWFRSIFSLSGIGLIVLSYILAEIFINRFSKNCKNKI